MTYAQELAFELRHRGLTEDRVAEALREMESHVQETGETPEAAFGSPAEYAATFPAKKSRTRGARVVTAFVVIAVLYVPAALVIRKLTGVDLSDWTGGFLILPVVAFLCFGLLAGFLIDYLRPAPRTKQLPR